MTDIQAQDCELEYWSQQAEDYALVQIPCEDLRAIINRAWEAPAFNSALTAAEAERNRAQLACQQIAERLTASEARAKAAEERVRELEGALKPFAEFQQASIVSYRNYSDADHFYTFNDTSITVGDLRTAARTLKGAPDER